MPNDARALKRLPKKDRDEVARIDELHKEDGATSREVLLNHLAELKNLADIRDVTYSDICSIFYRLHTYFLDLAVTERFLQNDPSLLAKNLSTSARFGYLKAVAGGTRYSGGYDCLHVFDLLRAIACCDFQAADSFIARLSPPFKSGHPTTVLLCNSIYAAYEQDLSTLKQFIPKLRSRKDSKFFRAMYSCLTGIYNSSAHDVASSIASLLLGNRRQTHHSQMEKIICIEAHAFYRLCSRHSAELVAQIDTAAPFPWDADFHNFSELAQSCEHGPTPEVIDTNKYLGQLLCELPETIEVDELLAEL